MSRLELQENSQTVATINDMIHRHALAQPDMEVMICGDQRLTWRDFFPRICAVANALKERGIGKGDTVCILAKGSVAYVEIFLGCCRPEPVPSLCR